MDVYVGPYEKHVPVSAFVSMVSRTTRINTKLENLLLALLSCRNDFVDEVEDLVMWCSTSNIIPTTIRMSARAADIDHT